MDIVKEIRSSKSIKNKADRLERLNEIAHELANNFTEAMSHLELEIEFVLDRTSERVKNELGYHSVEDVTQDINVVNSFDY